MDKENQEDGTEEDIQNEIAKIKGDAIGNTLYSERWVLKTLIKLSKYPDEVEWSSELEQELCLLWDMTTESDVVKYMISHEIIDLVSKVVLASNSTRLTEILIGMLGNMCCLKIGQQALAIKEDSCKLLLSLLNSEDSLTLIQLIRLLNSCLWHLRVEAEFDNTRSNSPVAVMEVQGAVPQSDDHWLQITQHQKQFVLQHLCFYLASSTNDELLRCTLELLETLLKIPQLTLQSELSACKEFTSSLVESLKQLLRSIKSGDSVTSNRALWKACDAWKNIVGMLAGYQLGRVNLGLHGNTMLQCFIKLMGVLSTPEALKTQDPEIVLHCLYILETLPDVQFQPKSLAKLISVLHEVSDSHDTSSKPDGEQDSLDEECFNLGEMLQRTEHFVRHYLQQCDDLAAVVQSLKSVHLSYLFQLVSIDEILAGQVDSVMIATRTSGLVQ